MWKIFKKKKEEKKQERTDFSKYKIKINGKVMCAYEAMTGRPFMRIETADDIMHLFYCSLVINNEDFENMEYEVFQYLMNDKEVLNWMLAEYTKIGKYISQFKPDIGIDEGDEEEEKGDKKDKNVFFMLDAISGLIVRMGIDPDYVMYRMEEWEITYYYSMMREMDRSRLTEERLWTYLQILPHVGKKLAGPEKMLPFPWEDSKKKKLKELENNTAAAVAFLSKAVKTDGKGKHDDRAEQA